MSGAVARYFASIGFKVDKTELANIDRTLSNIEKKLRAFGKNIDKHLNITLKVNKVDIDQSKLKIAVGNALDYASKHAVFEITRFAVNDRSLQAALMRASRIAGNRIRPTRQPVPNEVVPTHQHTPTPRERKTTPSKEALGAGGMFGLATRLTTPVMTAAMGGYGLYQLNKTNQEVVAAKMQTEAVQQAFGGTKEQGDANFKWLQEQADRVGFNWLEASGDYNNLRSNLMGAGGTSEDANTIFKGFAEYGRVNKLSDARQKLVFNALGQIAGKNALQAEELTKQLGNSLPGAKSIFAEAWQRKTGGNLQGGEAIRALEQAMKEKKVKGDILTIAAQIASEKAAPGLEAASKASQAEQNRFRNAKNAMAVVASENGVEEGFARIFRALTTAMKESTPLVEKLAKGFNEMSKYISFATLLPQSLKRAFEGRDSWVGDMLGKERVKIVKDLFDGLGEVSDAIKETLGIALKGWKEIFDVFGDKFMGFLSTLKDIFLYSFKILNSLVKGDTASASRYGEAMQASMMGADAETVKAIAEGKPRPADVAAPNTDTVAMAANALLNIQNLPRPEGLIEGFAKASMHFDYLKQYDKARNMAVGDNTSPYYQDPAGFDAQAKDMFEAIRNQGWGRDDQRPPEVNNTIQVTVQAVPGKEIDAKETGGVLVDAIQSALQFFGQK